MFITKKNYKKLVAENERLKKEIRFEQLENSDLRALIWRLQIDAEKQRIDKSRESFKEKFEQYLV